MKINIIRALPIALALSFASVAHATLIFNFTVVPSSITTGGSANLTLSVTGQVDAAIGAVSSFIESVDLTFSSGDGQTFHLVGSTPVMNHIDFQHQFTFPTAGLFSPSVAGAVGEAEPVAASVAHFSRSVNLTSALTVTAPASVPDRPTLVYELIAIASFGCALMLRRRSGATG